MPEVLGDYVKVLVEKNRAIFFGTVPNYIANLDIEIARMETAHPTWASNPGLQTMIQARHASFKYGKKKGSPHQEV